MVNRWWGVNLRRAKKYTWQNMTSDCKDRKESRISTMFLLENVGLGTPLPQIDNSLNLHGPCFFTYKMKGLDKMFPDVPSSLKCLLLYLVNIHGLNQALLNHILLNGNESNSFFFILLLYLFNSYTKITCAKRDI